MPHLSFTEHPHEVGETYLQHLHSAWSFSGSMLVGGIACFLHGLFPFLCTRTGSTTIRRLHDRMIVHRVRSLEAAPAPLVTPTP